MNIEKIKSEFERLSQIISAWSDNEPIAAIERDLALDKLLKIYDMVRFAENSSASIATPSIEINSQEPIIANTQPADELLDELNDELNDVEVEFIFAEEQDAFEVEESQEQEELADKPQNQPAKEQSIGEILAATVAATVASEQAKQEVTPQAEAIVATTVEPEPMVVESEPMVETAPKVESVATPIEPAPKAEPAHKAEVAPKAEPKAAAPMSSLFGVEEPNRKPRTKHQRMMSIYNDAESRPEKVVDISKIFDLEADEPASATATTTATATPKKSEVLSAPKTTPKATPAIKEQTATIADSEPATTLGDVMAQNSQTLADTIVAPTALGEEISNRSIRSLRQGIGLNDKFLMIRDLFDGDADAYDEAIDVLDSFDDFDDCIIYIAENFAWNADSEGAKFIMQLLERKLS